MVRKATFIDPRKQGINRHLPIFIEEQVVRRCISEEFDGQKGTKESAERSPDDPS
jgi:hypothetical protein